LGLQWRNECENDGVVVGVWSEAERRNETRDEMRQDAVGCVVVEVPAGDEYTNDRRKSCADVWQAHTTTIWQPPPYPIPIGKTNAESSISAHALLFSILLNGDLVISGVT
jgi:hypothetical protein